MRIAIAPAAGTPDGAANNLALLDRCAAAAAAAQVDLLVLGELFLCGADGGHGRCEPFDGPSLAAACTAARNAGVALLFGFAERAGNAVYNAAAVIGPDGVPLGTYRKAHPGPHEKGRFAAGQGMPGVARIGGMTVGVLIGCDADFPEPARDLALRGCDVIALPALPVSAAGAPSRLLVAARACENRVFVACAAGADSRVLGPDGRPLVNTGAAACGLVVADLDPAGRRPGPGAMDYLAERRPALYARLAERHLERAPEPGAALRERT
ncbi:nitrilase-related carbon-nitrogen hydrolase [Azospirillum halopraeferens]|uniref:nitrilase-related carbon-nitrogen hydrolase n=1 Tax=Azospirillum halopraeferens TaxID=34010 RepID=UPI0003FBCC76|nr:nitrilase-related carbon-nitrogen hydrolase [Azospirillum halopraeferens]